MPMYEFDCHACHKSFEDLVYSDGDLTAVTCPACDSHDVSKKLSAFAVGASVGSSLSATESYGSACSTGGCCSGGCG